MFFCLFAWCVHGVGNDDACTHREIPADNEDSDDDNSSNDSDIDDDGDDSVAADNVAGECCFPQREIVCLMVRDAVYYRVSRLRA